MCLTISLAETAICARSKTSKRTTNVIIKKIDELRGGKLRRKLQKQRDLNHLDFCDIYWRERESKALLWVCLFLSLSLSSLLLPTPSLSLCRGERKGSKNQHQQELLPTPAQPGRSSLIAHLLPSSFVI